MRPTEEEIAKLKEMGRTLQASWKPSRSMTPRRASWNSASKYCDSVDAREVEIYASWIFKGYNEAVCAAVGHDLDCFRWKVGGGGEEYFCRRCGWSQLASEAS